ncbi:MAG: hypothetical protein RL726_905, partial [Actinomycetota bacterium]
MRIRRLLPFVVLGLGTASVVRLVRSRKSGDSGRIISAIERGTMAARNTELVRLGGRVGLTYASATARKAFANAERRIEIDHETELKTAAQVSER